MLHIAVVSIWRNQASIYDIIIDIGYTPRA